MILLSVSHASVDVFVEVLPSLQNIRNTCIQMEVSKIHMIKCLGSLCWLYWQHKEMGIGCIVRALNPLKHLETDLRMCLPWKRPSTWLGVWRREFTHRLTMVLTGSLVYILLVLCVPVVLPAWKPLCQCRPVFFPLLCQSQRGAFRVSSSFFCFSTPAFRKEANLWFHSSGIIYIILSFDYALNFIPWNCNMAWVLSHLRAKYKSYVYSLFTGTQRSKVVLLSLLLFYCNTAQMKADTC